MSFGAPTIKPMNIPADQLAKLKQALDSNKLGPRAKDIMQARITGRCCVSDSDPTKLGSYPIQGAVRIERYCDRCAEREFARI